jgi:hypothetical protein
MMVNDNPSIIFDKRILFAFNIDISNIIFESIKYEGGRKQARITRRKMGMASPHPHFIEK